MQIEWISQRGSQRHSNNDAAGVGIGKDCIIALVVDAAENQHSDSNRAQQLARHWCQLFAQEVLQLNGNLDMDYLRRRLLAEQQKLRHDYLHEIASYCLAAIVPGSGLFHVLFCGDCMAGTTESTAASKSITWLHQPHTLWQHYNHLAAITPAAHATGEKTTTHSTLTRSLNARRFDQPDIVSGTLLPEQSLILASDGYRAQHNHDDSSALILTAGTISVQSHSDCENLVILPTDTSVTPKGTSVT